MELASADTPATTNNSSTLELTATDAGTQETGATAAVEFVRSLSKLTVPYTTRGIVDGDWSGSELKEATRLFDPEAVSVQISAAEKCWQNQAEVTATTVTDIYELKHEGFLAHMIGPGLWVVAYRVVEVVPGVSDVTTDRAMYVTSNGIIGDRSVDPAEEPSCWNTAIERTTLGDALLTAALEAGSQIFDPAPDDVDLDLAIAGYTSDVASGATGGQFIRRDGYPADPNDPEPIRSTGTDKLDVLAASDPSVFACLMYQGRATEEILYPDKGSYETVPNAFLFVAHFRDGTTIDIRVHPEVGTLEDVTAEVAKYVTPLGQLPTLLRRDIGRFAIRSGDETATASPLEGISMQTGNAAVRLADGRLEETIFHESVHTSLDPRYVYGTSTEWFDAQELDGRFLTEYGRNNPDGEDLAETALYAFVLLHHPERIPASLAAAIKDRVPNRLTFIESILPPGRPIFDLLDSWSGCE